jgi:hypothetical protein
MVRSSRWRCRAGASPVDGQRRSSARSFRWVRNQRPCGS